MPVAAEVARALDAPLDVLVVRKLGCPWQPELGTGAIAEGDITVLNEELIARIGADDGMIEAVADRERVELMRRIRRYRGDRPSVPVEGAHRDPRGRRDRDRIDRACRDRRAPPSRRLPGRARGAVAPEEAVVSLRAVADEVVVVEVPRMFMAIGQFYDDFSQTRDDEVAELLADRPTPSAGVH